MAVVPIVAAIVCEHINNYKKGYEKIISANNRIQLTID